MTVGRGGGGEGAADEPVGYRHAEAGLLTSKLGCKRSNTEHTILNTAQHYYHMTRYLHRPVPEA